MITRTEKARRRRRRRRMEGGRVGGGGVEGVFDPPINNHRWFIFVSVVQVWPRCDLCVPPICRWLIQFNGAIVIDCTWISTWCCLRLSTDGIVYQSSEDDWIVDGISAEGAAGGKCYTLPGGGRSYESQEEERRKWGNLAGESRTWYLYVTRDPSCCVRRSLCKWAPPPRPLPPLFQLLKKLLLPEKKKKKKQQQQNKNKKARGYCNACVIGGQHLVNVNSSATMFSFVCFLFAWGWRYLALHRGHWSPHRPVSSLIRDGFH